MSSRRQEGFTLVELMVVVVIIAILAAVAVPALTGDDTEAEFRRYVRLLSQDLHRARYEAISTREDRAIVIPAAVSGMPSSYSVQAVLANPLTRSQLKAPVLAHEQVLIAGVLGEAALPSKSYTPPGSLPAELRFIATSALEVEIGATTGNVASSPATIFLRSADDVHKARIVIYGTTGYSRTYFSW